MSVWFGSPSGDINVPNNCGVVLVNVCDNIVCVPILIVRLRSRNVGLPAPVLALSLLK